MMKALLYIRFRALFAGLMKQNRQKKKTGKGSLVLFIFLYLYVGVVLCGAMGFLFYSLAQPYHAAGLDWLYFSMAGLMGLGFAVIGSVFTTQSQLYDAKDNDLLLAMPIPPRQILSSRMLPLLAMNLVFAGIVMVPAIVVYAAIIEFSLPNLLPQLLSLAAAAVLAQAIACLLGWLLHLLLSRINKSIASMLYLVVFLAIYFSVYSQAGEILNAMAVSGEVIAGTLKTWVWPLYAMGAGCQGNIPLVLAFIAICSVTFFLVYRLLTATFLRSATARRSGKKRRLDMRKIKAVSTHQAIIKKELKHFLATPVYLTNMGIGLLFIAALTLAGLIFRNTLLSQLGDMLPSIRPYFALIISAILAFTASMSCISTPSISLEGKHIWILKSLPVSTRQILLGKLKFHCLMATPITFLSGLILAIGYGCGIFQALLAGAVPALLSIICGLFGLICDLKWTRLDWISEAYPCKQSVSVMVVMFSMMGVPFVLGFGYIFLEDFLSPTAFLALTAVVLCTTCFGLYKALVNWGSRKWEHL